MSGNTKSLPLPPMYDQTQAFDRTFRPNVTELAQSAASWKATHRLTPAGADPIRLHLLVIDNQVDFCFPDGALFVGGRSGQGAMEDQDRLVRFIAERLGLISEITCTLDSHLPYQIFHPAAHLRADGSHPDPMTPISAEAYRKGEYRANPAMAKQLSTDPVWLSKQFSFYCEQLEQTGKYQLMVWPYHCLLGSDGHRLSGVVDAARLFHAFARGSTNAPEVKGLNPLTEHYSIFRPEVMTCFDGRAIPKAEKNTKLIEKLMKSDLVVIAGQAASHCVKTSIDDFLAEILTQDPKLARKVFILEDCTSAVVVPGVIDFTAEAEAALKRFAEAGMNIVRTTTPIEEWPDSPYTK